MKNIELRLTSLDKYLPGGAANRARRRRFAFGWFLSFAFYLTLTGAVIYQGISSEFGQIHFVDEEAERLYSVTWVTRRKPLRYPPGFFAPQQTKSLEEIERERQRAEQQRQARERRAAAAAKKRAEQQAQAAAEQKKAEQKKQDEQAQAGQKPGESAPGVPAESAANTTGAPAAPAEPEKPAEPPRVAINTNPLRQHINEAVDRYRKGQLTLNLNSLHGTLKVKLDPEGNFEEVRMARSSGSPDADNLAIVFLKELMAQPGMKPFLSKFTTITIAVDATAAEVALSVEGETGSSAVAVTMASLLKLATAQGKQRVAPDSKTAFILNNVQVEQEGLSIKARITVPRSVAGEVMKEFGTKLPPKQT